MSSYYHYPLGEVLGTILPSAARKGADFTIKPEPPPDVWCLGDLTVVSPRAKTQQAVIEHMQQTSSAQTGDALIAAGFNRAMLRKLEESGALKRQMPDAEQALDTALAPTPEQDHAISQINAYNTLLIMYYIYLPYHYWFYICPRVAINAYPAVSNSDAPQIEITTHDHPSH